MDPKWIVSMDYRWYRSDRHFVGDVEQPQRQANGTEVVNEVHSVDISGTYRFSPRWSTTLTIPFIYADRSSLYEHDGVNRHSMHSSGFGDVRLAGDYWLLNPAKHKDANLAIGLGLKLPTGDDQAQDTAYRSTGAVKRPVDPSIQPGDGGWGIILELQAYWQIYGALSGYVQGSYLVTPQEHNHTQTPNADKSPVGLTTYDSITDQYFARAGFDYGFFSQHQLTVSFGSRIEGVPVYDALGGSMGFRRPGYTVSLEPGISWKGSKNSISIYAPVAVYRNREHSAPEIVLNRHNGDAAFADFSIIAAFEHRF